MHNSRIFDNFCRISEHLKTRISYSFHIVLNIIHGRPKVGISQKRTSGCDVSKCHIINNATYGHNIPLHSKIGVCTRDFSYILHSLSPIQEFRSQNNSFQNKINCHNKMFGTSSCSLRHSSIYLHVCSKSVTYYSVNITCECEVMSNWNS